MRARGEGSIYQDADGRWRGAVVVGWEPDPTRASGQRPIRKKVSGTSARDVAGKLRALQRDLEDGRTEWTRSPTVRQWLERWVEDVARPTIAPGTYETYAVVVRRACEHLGHRRLEAVKPEHIEDMFAEMRAAGKGGSAGNIHVHYRVLRTAFGVAVRRGQLRANPCDAIDLPKPRKYRPRQITVEEAGRILDVAAGRRNYARWLLALVMGWRQGEALGLSWGQINFDAGTITRDRQLARVRGQGLQIRRTKTEATEGVIPMPAVVTEALKAVRVQQRRDRIAAGPHWVNATLPVDGGDAEPAWLVFTRLFGQPISREDDWSQWHELLKAADVAPTRLHDARHASASFLGALGVHPTVAQAILGHSAVEMTLHYTHASDALARDAVERMSDLLRPGTRSTS